MSTLTYILIFTLLGSVISLIGGFILLFKASIAHKVSHFLSAFAAGTLLGVAFFDLLPESLHEMEHLLEEGVVSEEINIFFWVLVGILIFFLLERFIHHHDNNPDEKEKKAIIPMIIIGDTLHNFIDGVAIAATFLISVPLGVVTTLAVAAHEIPQEIADFGLMISKGVKRSKILWINLISSLAALIGAMLTFIHHDKVEILLPVILSITSGFFIYIALTNLIPEIHSRENKKTAFWETVILFAGVAVIYLTITTLEGAH